MDERLRKVEQQTALLPDMYERVKKIDDRLHGEGGINIRLDRLEQKSKFMDKISWTAFVAAATFIGKWTWEHVISKAFSMAVKIFPWVTFVALLFACVPTRQERRCNKADKKIRKAIVKCPDVLKADTIPIRDTIVTPAVYIDTIIPKDSIIYLERDKWHVRIEYLPGEKVRVTGRCDPDTVYYEAKAVTHHVQANDKFDFITFVRRHSGWFFWSLLIAFLLYVVRKEGRNKNKT